MAAQVMKEGKVQMVVVGADRIASNGDTANKIGTYGVALLAKAHAHSVLRRRAVEHVRSVDPRRLRHPDRTARPARGHPRLRPPDRPRWVEVYNPAFDVTPAELIAGIITEKGVIRPVSARMISEILGNA